MDLVRGTPRGRCHWEPCIRFLRASGGPPPPTPGRDEPTAHPRPGPLPYHGLGDTVGLVDEVAPRWLYLWKVVILLGEAIVEQKPPAVVVKAEVLEGAPRRR